MLYMPYSFTAAGYAGHQEVDATLRRSDLGLPARGFVMCSFNRLEKLDEPTFGLWLQLLIRIPGSVLWIYEPDGDAEDATAEELRTRSHLLASAAAAGISASQGSDGSLSAARILFAGRRPKAEHLGRLRQADLFLDGAQYSAHTIAADVLWAGLPLITCPQAAFASRVSASMSIAAGAALLPIPSAATELRETGEKAARVARVAGKQMLSMVPASWKEYADTGSLMGGAVTAGRRLHNGGVSAAQVSEGAFSGRVRAMQESHPLFDTGVLVDALEARLIGLARARQ